MSIDWKFIDLPTHYYNESLQQFYFELEKQYGGQSSLDGEAVWAPLKLTLPGRMRRDDQFLPMDDPLEVFEAHQWGLKGLFPVDLEKGTSVAVVIPMVDRELAITGQVAGLAQVMDKFMLSLNFTKAQNHGYFVAFVRQIRGQEASKYYEMTGKERRRFFRLPCVLQVRYLVQDGNSWLPGNKVMRSFNLSAGGLGVETFEVLSVKQPLKVSFAVEGREFTLPARVAWIDKVEGDSPQYGVEFTQVPEPEQDALIRLIVAEQQRRQGRLEERYRQAAKE